MNELEYEFHSYSDNYLPFNYHFEEFDPDIYAPNWHNEIEILYITEGAGKAKINGVDYQFYKDDILFVNSDCIHYIQAETNLKYHCFQIKSEFFTENAVDINKLNICPVINSPIVNIKYEKAVKAFESHIKAPNPDSTVRMISRLKIRSYVINMLSDLISAGYKSSEASDINAQNRSVKHVKLALAYISDKLTTHFRVEDIANSINISKHHLIREFKKQTGYSILEYRNILRCQKAKTMIQNGSSITNAAISCGFDDISHFGSIYKKIMGVAPSKTNSNETQS